MERSYKVAIDTNILLYIKNQKIDVFNELKSMFGNVEFFIPESVLEELKILKEKGKKYESAVRLAEELIEKENVKVIKMSKNADKDLVELAKKGYFILTNDSEIKKKVKNFAGKLIYPRSNKMLEVMGNV